MGRRHLTLWCSSEKVSVGSTASKGAHKESLHWHQWPGLVLQHAGSLAGSSLGREWSDLNTMMGPEGAAAGGHQLIALPTPGLS